MKKGTASPAKGGGSSNNKNSAFSSSASYSAGYNNNKGSMGSFKSESKYSSQGGGAKDKYSSEQKCSAKNLTSESKYSSQEKYSKSNGTASMEKQYKSIERYQNEANAARDKMYQKMKEQTKENKYWGTEKEADTKTKYSSDSKYSTDSKYSKTEVKSSWPSSSFATDTSSKYQDKDKDKSKYKYSSTTEDRWSSKNFSSPDQVKTFSSQCSTSSWEERNRGRAFPYDRDHELRRSQRRYETDVRNLDPKYRKTTVSGVSGAAVSAVGLGAAGVGMGAVSGAAPSSGANNTMMREDHSGATGCHNCTLL